MTGNLHLPTTPDIGLSITQAMTPGPERARGGVLAVGCWHTRQVKRNFNNLLIFKITLDNIKKQVYITIQ